MSLEDGRFWSGINSTSPVARSRATANGRSGARWGSIGLIHGLHLLPTSLRRERRAPAAWFRPMLTRLQLAGRSVGEERVQNQRELRQNRAGERSTGSVTGVDRELTRFGLAEDMNLLFGAEDEPAFLNAGAGVGGKLGTVVVVTGEGDFDDEFGGVRMVGEKITFGSTDDGNVRLRLGVEAGDGLFRADKVG